MSETFLEQHVDEQTGIVYYHLPTGSMLYRGDTLMYDKIQYKESVAFDNNFVFFSVDPGTVEQYGIVFEFQTTRDYNVVALDNRETIALIYQSANTNIQGILRKNYGYTTSTAPMIRYSESKADKELSKYLCDLDYDGYGTNKMASEFGGSFHKELMICKPQDIHFVRQVTTNHSTIQSMLDENKIRNLNVERKTERKKPRRNYGHSRMFDPSPEKKEGDSPLLFSSSSFDSPIKKGLFNDDDDTPRTPPRTPRGGRRSISTFSTFKKSGVKTKARHQKKIRKTRKTKRRTRHQK